MSFRLVCVFSLVQFGVTQATCQVNQNVSTKAPGELSITSVRSPHLQPFAEHFELFLICLCFLSVGLFARLQQHKDGNIFHLCSRSTIVFMFVSQQTPVCLRSHPQSVMHSTASYGSWFSPKMCNSSSNLGSSRSDHVYTKKEPCHSRSSCFGPQPTLITVLTPTQTNCTKKENEPKFDLTELNSGVKTPFVTCWQSLHVWTQGRTERKWNITICLDVCQDTTILQNTVTLLQWVETHSQLDQLYLEIVSIKLK